MNTERNFCKRCFSNSNVSIMRTILAQKYEKTQKYLLNRIKKYYKCLPQVLLVYLHTLVYNFLFPKCSCAIISTIINGSMESVKTGLQITIILINNMIINIYANWLSGYNENYSYFLLLQFSNFFFYSFSLPRAINLYENTLKIKFVHTVR